ncbi:MAG: sulfatase-like hydrolase/transferase [Verrucomicrobiota bacterium]
MPRIKIHLYALFLVPLSLPLSANAQVAGSKPNIIFILCDDLGYGDIGVFFQNARKAAGNRSEPWHFTPQLDLMAEQGLQLRQHYTAAPVCAPARGSLLTGVHQGHAGVRDNQFDKALENNHTLATVLKEAGYATAVIGKWGLQGNIPSGQSQPAWPAFPLNRGFDYFFGYVGHGAGHEHYPKEGLYTGPKDVWENNSEISATLDKCYTTDLFTARAKKWIVDQKSAQPDQPFFMYLAYDTPHAVLELPTQAYPAGGGLNGGLQWTGTPGSMINTASGTIDSYTHPDYASATWDDDNNPATAEVSWPNVYKRYAAGVRRLDDCVGDMLKLLEDLDISNDTLIVFTSDNGPSTESYLPAAITPNFFNSFGPFDGIKRDTWEGGIRSGALAHWPGGIPANRISEVPSQFHDWMSTFAELAGVPAPARTDGVSLVPTLTGTATQPPGTVYVEYSENGNTPSYAEFEPSRRGRKRNEMQALRIGDYMGVRYQTVNHGVDFEIYDIANDPKQSTNLASSNAILQQTMKDTVLRLRRPNASASRPYDDEFIPAVSPPSTANGVDWKAYEENFPWLPKLQDLTPVSTGDIARPDLSVLPDSDDVGLLFTGYLSIPTDGAYTFYLNADTGAYLRIHEASVIDADFGYPGSTEESGTIRLKAGKHPFRLYYRHGGVGTPALSLQWSGPGITKTSVPDSIFLRDVAIPPGPPTALDDTVTTAQATPVEIAVLNNDSDDGTPQPISIQSVGTPQRGTAIIQGNTVRYTPDATFLGEDTFTYTITDGAATATASVRVAVAFSDGDYWFPFNQSSGFSATEAGGGVTATLSGFTSTTAPWVSGKSDRAIAFDGIDDEVAIDGFTGVLGTGARTCALWVKTTATNSPLIAWGSSTSGGKWVFLLDPTGRPRVEITGGYTVGTTPVNDGQWHHVACTFANDGTPNANDVKLYLDGALQPVSDSSAQAMNTAADGSVKIGADAQSRYFSGTLDDVRIYRRALSPGEIADLAATPETFALAWHRRYLGNAPVDWTADDDNDGFSRLLEYALGGQPQIREVSLYAPTGISNDRFQWSYPQRKTGTHNLTYLRQVSRNLVDWTVPVELVSTSPLNADFDLVTYQATPHISTEPVLFFRLQVSPP